MNISLTLSLRKSLSYRHQSIDLLCKSMDRFLYDRDLRHGFGDTINPMGACRAEVETFKHFLLSCYFYSTQKSELFDKPEKVDPNFLNLNAKR